MQESDFNNFFLPEMNKNGRVLLEIFLWNAKSKALLLLIKPFSQGYECRFKKRFGESKTDGCAICFKAKKFELLKDEHVDYYNPDFEILNR